MRKTLLHHSRVFYTLVQTVGGRATSIARSEDRDESGYADDGDGERRPQTVAGSAGTAEERGASRHREDSLPVPTARRRARSPGANRARTLSGHVATPPPASNSIERRVPLRRGARREERNRDPFPTRAAIRRGARKKERKEGALSARGDSTLRPSRITPRGDARDTHLRKPRRSTRSRYADALDRFSDRTPQDLSDPSLRPSSLSSSRPPPRSARARARSACPCRSPHARARRAARGA